MHKPVRDGMHLSEWNDRVRHIIFIQDEHDFLPLYFRFRSVGRDVCCRKLEIKAGLLRLVLVNFLFLLFFREMIARDIHTFTNHKLIWLLIFLLHAFSITFVFVSLQQNFTICRSGLSWVFVFYYATSRFQFHHFRFRRLLRSNRILLRTILIWEERRRARLSIDFKSFSRIEISKIETLSANDAN